jgi:hypothetical protein
VRERDLPMLGTGMRVVALWGRPRRSEIAAAAGARRACLRSSPMIVLYAVPCQVPDVVARIWSELACAG